MILNRFLVVLIVATSSLVSVVFASNKPPDRIDFTKYPVKMNEFGDFKKEGMYSDPKSPPDWLDQSTQKKLLPPGLPLTPPPLPPEQIPPPPPVQFDNYANFYANPYGMQRQQRPMMNLRGNMPAAPYVNRVG